MAVGPLFVRWMPEKVENNVVLLKLSKTVVYVTAILISAFLFSSPLLRRMRHLRGCMMFRQHPLVDPVNYSSWNLVAYYGGKERHRRRNK